MKSLSCSSTRAARVGACPLLPAVRKTKVFRPKVSAVAAEPSTDLDASLEILKTAAADSSVPTKKVLDSVITLERMKLQPDGWKDVLAAPSARWLLVYTANSKDVVAASKEQASKGGFYMPIVACQKYEDGVFTNGIFLGDILYLTFSGPFQMTGRKLDFDVTKMTIGVGPWSFPITLKKDSPLTAAIVAINGNEAEVLKTKLPFFLYAYVDDEIKVARGRSGGLAIWKRVDSEWQSKNGVLRVYK